MPGKPVGSSAFLLEGSIVGHRLVVDDTDTSWVLPTREKIREIPLWLIFS